MWFQATVRWRVPTAQEVRLDLFVVPRSHDSDRKVRATVWKWVHNITKDTRSCSQLVVGCERGAFRIDARCDEIPERQEAHQLCGQG
jgi:hypothetical protein